MAKEDDKIMKLMHSRWNMSSDAEAANRQTYLEAVNFSLGGKYQWNSTMLDIRGKWNQPCESYNQIPQFVHQVTNDLRMNMPQIRFIPGNDANKETAEIKEDLARAIQAQSEAEVAFDSAVDNQVRGGWGYYRFVTEYEDDKSFNQIIKLRWIPSALTCYDDPTASLQDRSDRNFFFEVSDERIKDFNSTYGKNYDGFDLESIGDSSPAWCSGSNMDDGYIRVAEYWSLEETTSYLYKLKSGETTTEEPEEYEEKREVITKKVVWRKVTASEVLETKDWPGKYIPYCFVAGEETIVDGRHVLTGFVQNLMPAQRGYNYWMNTAIELAMAAPRTPFILDPKSIEGYEDYWDKLNVDFTPYLPFNQYANDISGRQYPTPQRASNAADVAYAVQMCQLFQDNMYKMSGISQSGLGYRSNESSGKAILARQKEGDVSTYHYGDNLARAQRAGGRVLDDLMTVIYDAPRLVKLLREDKTTYEARINESYMDKETGEHKHYDLTTGIYEIMVTTGPSFTTKRQEASDAMIQLAQSTNLMEVAPDIVYSTQDWPGADKIADRYRKTLPPQLVQDDKASKVPPEVQAQMQQMGALVEQLQATVQQQAQELESKQADIANKQADLQLKQQEMMVSGQSDQAKAQLDQLKIQLEAAKLEFEREKLTTETNLANQKMQLDLTKMRFDAKANQSSDMAMADPELYEDGVAPISQMMSMMTQVLSNGLAQVAQITAESSQAMILSNQQVAAAITAPKTFNVQRDPNTNLLDGVVSHTVLN